MKSRLLKQIKISTPAEERILPEGQIITLPNEKALPLIDNGKIEPGGRVAYLVYSRILEAFLWVVADDEDINTLRTSHRITDAVYTSDEIRKLKGTDKDTLKAVHNVKEVFPSSSVKEITNEKEN